MASKAIPPVMLPSPIMATICLSSPFNSEAMAMPKAALIDVLEWPTPKASYSLSARLGKAETPSRVRIVVILSLRPVNILCG